MNDHTTHEVQIILDNLRQSLRALEERTGPLWMTITSNVLAVNVDAGTGKRWQPLYRTEQS